MEAVLLPAAVGVLVGLVVGALGGGGGILTVPILVYLLDQDAHVAATSSLVIVGVTSLTALVPNARRGHVRWSEGLLFGLLGTVAAYLGAFLSLSVQEQLLMALFSVLLLVSAGLMLQRSWVAWHAAHHRAQRSAAGDDPEAPRRAARGGGPGRPPVVRRHPLRVDWRRAAEVLGWASVVGLLTGFFGVGGGFAVIPALVLGLRFGMRAAVGTSLLVIVVNSAVGFAARVSEGVTVDWVLIAAFTGSSVLAGLVGTRISARVRSDVLSTAFGLLLAAVSVATAAQAFPALLR
ncbi:sulfite exporter TauE/SafE family protein [Georgenia sp. 10Sc9-8]|uniref:Probable membrane transporter protein n=1 Tax=Georgenia halotolerans TaxID=3028317 RepID=A0ABT5TXM7_9MICO|nr:sulfite exporter TauE/SafE family protein [Georgenia halotolerans]